MNLLLDTHTLLWFFFDSPQLSPLARKEADSFDNDVAVSVVSFYELGLKIRRELISVSLDTIRAGCSESGFEWIDVTPDHASLASSFTGPHKDPWDRILAAQALLEERVLLSRDRKLDQFGAQRLW